MLEMSLINVEISLELKWSKDCIIVTGTADDQNPEFKITDTKFYVPVVFIDSRNHKAPQNNQSSAKQIFRFSN